MGNGVLPRIESIKEIDKKDLNLIKNIGFCLVKIDKKVAAILKELSLLAPLFFAKTETEKQAYHLDENLEGYLNHKVKGTVDIERYAYRGGALPEPFLKKAALIRQMRLYFINQIALPLIEKIFEHENILQFYDKTIDNSRASLTFIYYPYPSKMDRNLKAHKDIGLVTVLYITKPGLEVYANDKWNPIDPQSDYVVVNVGNCLELMTGGSYPSSLHRVQPPLDEDRITIASFISPDPNIPIVNYKTGKRLYPDYQSFFNEHIKYIYPEDNFEASRFIQKK